MYISLNISGGDQILTVEGLVSPLLATAPGITGDGREGTEISADTTDTWTYATQTASVTQREYRLLIDGAEAGAPQPTARFQIPANSAGSSFTLQIRAQVAADPDLWSRWQNIATGTVTGHPELSDPTANADGETGYTGTVTTDTGDGTLFWAVTLSATAPDVGTLKAANSQPIDAAGELSVGGTGLTAGTTYYIHFLQEDASGTDTAIATSTGFTTESPQATIPAAFGANDWAIRDAGTGGDAVLDILALPADGGEPLQSVEYRIDTGPWTSLGAAATGSFDLIDVFADGTASELRLRATNAVGAGPESAAKSVTTTPAPTAPDAFGNDDWAIRDAGTGGDAVLDILALPNDGGEPLQAVEYQIDAGPWTSLGAATTGSFDLIDVFADDTASELRLRATNAVGAGPESAAKSITTTPAPTEPAAFGDDDWAIRDAGTGGDAVLDILALPNDGGAAVTDLFVRVDGAAPQPVGGVVTGTYPLDDLFTDGVGSSVTLFAANALGSGPESDPKTITTTSPQSWSLSDLGDGRFTLAAAPAQLPAPAITDTGDGRFTIAV